MEMAGEARLEASRETVWEALNDPSVLQASIPGCEALDRGAENEFTATVVSKVGPIKARFSGKVTLSNINPPVGYTLTGEGSGGAAGFAKADIEVSLEALEQDVTLLRYGVKANVGGKLAQLGSRMVDAAARKSADEFFELFGKQVNEKVANGGAVQPNGSSGMAEILAAGAQEAASQASHGVNGKLPAAEPAPAPSNPHPTSTVGAIERATAGKNEPEKAAAASQAPAAPAPTNAINAPLVITADMQAEITDALMTEKLKVWISDGVAVLTLNRPNSRNAMTYGMWLAMPTVMAALNRNPAVRVVVLTGAGEDFCAGADISEFGKIRDDVGQATAYEQAVDACCDAIAGISKPTIAVMRGYTLGGGAHLAMSCDFRFAAANAIFGIPAAKLSIIYGVKGTRKLLSLVGLANAKKILFSAERFGAAYGRAVGFIDHVAGEETASQKPNSWWYRLTGGGQNRTTQGDPMSDARAFAKTMAANAPLSISGAKYQLNGLAAGNGALDLEQAEAMIAHAAGSADYREGREAFASKRAPKFSGS